MQRAVFKLPLRYSGSADGYLLKTKLANKMENNDHKEMGPFFGILSGLGAAFGVLALFAFVAGLALVDSSVSEMGRQYLVATGNLHGYAPMVDFYTHIKGVEYLIAGAFFVAFPAFFTLLDAHGKSPIF